MPAFTFNHLALSVTDVDKSVAFYQKVLQLEEIENTASSSETRWFSLNEGKQLHLIPRPDFLICVNKAVHLALATPDVAAFVRHLETLNIVWCDWRDTPTRDYIRKDGIRQVYFQDPDGYWIEVNEQV